MLREHLEQVKKARPGARALTLPRESRGRGLGTLVYRPSFPYIVLYGKPIQNDDGLETRVPPEYPAYGREIIVGVVA